MAHLRRGRGFESHENRRNERGILSSVTRPSVFLIRREKERHLARLHTPRSRGDVTGRSPPTPGRTDSTGRVRATLFLLVNGDSLSHLWKVAAKLKALLCAAWKIDAASYVSSLEAAAVTLPGGWVIAVPALPFLFYRERVKQKERELSEGGL